MTGQRDIGIQMCARTDLGRTRDHNEDTFLVADLTRGSTDFLDGGRAVVGPRGSLFLVADGMGGAAAGELASAMAAEAIFEHLKAAWTPSLAESGDDFVLRIRESVEAANDRIHRYAGEHPDSRGMGTTATVAGVFGGRLHLAQVGDSRAYLVRNGQVAQLTKDQSLMQRLIDAGEMTEEQAAQSERRNIILQALGVAIYSLFVVPGNERALRLYRRLGFLPVPYPEPSPLLDPYIYMVAIPPAQATLRKAARADVCEIQRVRRAVRENRLVSTVIEDDGRIVAFAIGNAGNGNIWALFVEPGYEGRGHGRRLHDEMVNWMWSRGLKRLWLTTGQKTRAQRFYELAGWQNGGIQPNGEILFQKQAP